MTPDERLVLVIGTNRNSWMPSFGFASHHIATAVADGRITEADLESYVPYATWTCRELAHKAGLLFAGDEPDGVLREASFGGRLTHVDTEDVSIAVDAIKALRDESFLRGGSWQFYTDDEGYVESVQATLDSLERARVERVNTYEDAARLMLLGDQAWREHNVRT